MIHQLKCHTGPFTAAWEGLKPYEIRSTADRHFAAGDTLLLVEVIPVGGHDIDAVATPCTGRLLEVEVTYVSQPGTWGLPRNLCVMATRVLRRNGEVPGFWPAVWRWLVQTLSRS